VFLLPNADRDPRAHPSACSEDYSTYQRTTFKREKLLGHGDEAIDKHKVFRNIPATSDGLLRADFVAKTRKMHVTETVDLRTDGDLSIGRMKDIAVAAVTLDEAKRFFGRNTQRYFIYAAKSAAERQARG
jgi:hypothetical protein